MKEQKIISVAGNNIEPGIKKYQGKVDKELNDLCQAAGLKYTVYAFVDGRILLVLPNNIGGFLYPNREILFNSLSLE